MNWLVRLSLTNRAIVGLVTVLVVLFGAISATSLRQELLPSLDIPVVSVVTPYPGVSPEQVEQQVTTPIEAAVGGITGVTGTRSTSTGGASVITVDLKFGSDLPEVTSQVQRAVQGVTLPSGVTPQVAAGSTDNIPVVQLAVSSELGDDQVAAVLRDDVRPLLAGLDGVADVTLSGMRDPQIIVDVSAAAAALSGVALSSISTVLEANGVRVPAGQLTPDTEPVAVEVGSPITSVEQLRDLYIPPDSPTNSVPVRLGAIATVTAESATPTGYTRTNGVPSIGIEVTKQAQANTVAVSEKIRGALPQILEQLGGSARNAQVTVVLDQAPFIKQSIDDLTSEGLLGLVFAVLVILGFLLSVRATLVTAVSIPLSVLIAIIVLDKGGYTLNILTLGALTVAIGRVVDDSIVVIENIKRHVGHGGPRHTAIVTAVREVAGAITASTVTTVAVFSPMALVGGQVGELFGPFAVTVTAALLASLLVSLTVVPVLASAVLRSPQHPALPADVGSADADADADADGTAPVRTRLQRGYLPVLAAALRRPVVSLVVAAAILFGTVALVPQLRTNFLGDAGGGTVSVSQELPPGTGLPQADAAARRVEGVLGQTPGLASYQVTVGLPTGGSGFAPTGATTGVTHFTGTLKADADATAVADDLRARLDALSQGGPDQVGTLTVQAGPGGNDQLQIVVRAEDPAVLAQAAGQVRQAVAAIPDVVEVRNSLVAATPVVGVVVDRQRAARAGLTEAQIGQSVSTALRGKTVGAVTIDGVEQSVLVRAGSAPADVAALQKLPLPTPRGTVPLSDVATVTQSTTPPSISHTDGSRSAQITARPAADDLGAVTAALVSTLDGLDLPAGATAAIGGVSVEQSDAFAQLGLALLVAIAMVYLVMVLAFRSLLQPLLLLVAIPFAATGALGLLLLTGTPLGIPALIGMLMLIGIVVTNAIVLIDRVNQYRRSGRPLRDAVVEGSAQRLRPILMTAVATVFALLPMALGLTGGGVFISQSLAIVVIGGLISSTLLTLVLVPVLYLLAERGRSRLSRWRADPAADAGAAGHTGVLPSRPHRQDRPDGDAAMEPQRVAVGAVVGTPAPGLNGRHPSLVGAGAAAATDTAATDTAATDTAATDTAATDAATAAPPAPLPSEGHGVYGLVTDREGVRFAGAALAVFDTRGTQVSTATSDQHGRYRIAVRGAGEYLLVGQAGGSEPTAEWIIVPTSPMRHDLRVEGAGARR